MRKIFILSLFFLLSQISFSQTSIISGKIVDKFTKESLPGVNIFNNESHGTTSLEDGSYKLKVLAGNYKLVYSYIGYETVIKEGKIAENENIEINISLKTTASELDEVVISAGKFEQKRSDVTISMEVIKNDFLENNHSLSLENAIQKVPGMMMMDGQASIRGGSGYSYGAGSRVLLLIDGMPLMTGASGEAKWDFLPAENIEQIEIIKGASSALYGSSALNGVVNVRTSYPRNKPETKALISFGAYDNPKREAINWWGNQRPLYYNGYVSHSRKIGNLDVNGGFAYYLDDGYKQNESEEKYRLNFNTRYRFKNISGLSVSLAMNYMHKDGDMFLIWKDGDSGVYQPSLSFIQEYKISRFNLDPAIEYLNGSKSKQSLKTRFYRIDNQNNTNQSNTDFMYYGEYQYQKYFKANATLTSGVVGNYVKAISELYGNRNHNGYNLAVFSQYDRKFEKFNFSLGGRYEAFSLNGDKIEAKPVLRTGLSYKLNSYSNLRASFGQGYRFPTIAEKYTFTQVGSLKIFSNDTLQAETGWSSEIGYMQALKFGKISGLLDVAIFWTQYQNMIEFMFGQHYPEWVDPNILYIDTFVNYTGFKAYNVTSSRIRGIDVSINGSGEIKEIPINFLLGYTFTDPTYLNFNPDEVKGTSDQNILKYRFYHNAKLDINTTYKKITLGLNIDYHSNIINIDKAFEDSIRLPNGFPLNMVILPGLQSYRAEHNRGDVVFDLRLGYQFNEKHKVMLMAKNILNREYMIRPADVQPPRNFVIQYILKM